LGGGFAKYAPNRSSCVAVICVIISPRHDLLVNYRRMDGRATCNGNPVQSRVNPLIFMVSVSFHPLIRVIFNFRSRYLFAIGLPFQYLALEEIQLPYSDCTSKQPYSDLKAIYTNLPNRSDYHRLCIPEDARFPTCFIGRFAQKCQQVQPHNSEQLDRPDSGLALPSSFVRRMASEDSDQILS
jgi:hypothetical protein